MARSKRPSKRSGKKRTVNSSKDDKLIESGVSALRREYYGEIRDTARDILDEAESGLDDYDEAREYIDERLHEAADGSQWVIYTAKNLDVLKVSDNWLAIDELGDFSYSSLSEALAPSAYYAYRQDLQESVDAQADEYWKDRDENPRRKKPVRKLKRPVRKLKKKPVRKLKKKLRR